VHFAARTLDFDHWARHQSYHHQRRGEKPEKCQKRGARCEIMGLENFAE
jgi:hypothetical protein